MRNTSPHTLWDIKLFDVPRPPPPTLVLFPFEPGHTLLFPPCTLLKATLVFQPASAFSFPIWTPHHHRPQPPETKRRVTVVLCSQVFSIAAPGRNCSSPHSAAALPSLPLCGSIVQLPTPRWFIGHTGEALSDCVCAVRVEYACLGETGCCMHLPTATPPLPPSFPLSLYLIVKPLHSDWWRSSHSKWGEWQTLLVHLFCHSLSNLPASVEKKRRIQLRKTQRGQRLESDTLLYLQNQTPSLDTAAVGTFLSFSSLVFKDLNPWKWANLHPFLHCLLIFYSLVSVTESLCL